MPAGDRGRRAARGAAGRLLRIPRIARDAGERAVGHALPAELGRRGLAEEHRAVLAQPRGRRRVVVPRALRIDRLRAAQRRPALGQDDVLDRHRHAVEQALRLPAGQRASEAFASSSAWSETRLKAFSTGIQLLDALRAPPASPRPARAVCVRIALEKRELALEQRRDRQLTWDENRDLSLIQAAAASAFSRHIGQARL